jgi:hypothetical protein
MGTRRIGVEKMAQYGYNMQELLKTHENWKTLKN